VLLCIVKAPGRVWTLSLATSLAAASHQRTPPYRKPRPALAHRTAHFGPSLCRTVSLPHSPGATCRARHGQAAPTTPLAQRCRNRTGPHVNAVSRSYRGLGMFRRARTTSPSHRGYIRPLPLSSRVTVPPPSAMAVTSVNMVRRPVPRLSKAVKLFLRSP
jgi:hypothetical protein